MWKRAEAHERLSCNKIAEVTGKHPSEFTKSDLIHYISVTGIKHVNFMYAAADGRLKTLNFIINDKEYLDEILTCGERVDGSSLFAFVEACSSDLYVIPRYKTAFVDPFAKLPTLSILCGYFDKNGNRLESSPGYTLHKACQAFRQTTGLDFEAMGELEFYVIGPDPGHFPASDQHGYHESAPFSKFHDFRQHCLQYIAQTGGRVKYGHNEVGCFQHNGKLYEQHEIEFLPVPAEEAADQVILAKWVIRNLAVQYSLDVTFAPKITTGRAGSGLHIHMRLMKNGENQMLEGNDISVAAQKMIAGMMTLAPSLTAFGNRNPTSYFRLVPHQEAPTNICWGEHNRSALVRVPLGWKGSHILEKVGELNRTANGEAIAPSQYDVGQKQTIEIRSPDGSANIYLLLAALAVACRVGFQIDDALGIANKTRVSVDIHQAENADLLQALAALPDSCVASAECLQQQRFYYEEGGVFSTGTIDETLVMLRSFDDCTLREDIEDKPDEILALVAKHFHCG